LKSQKLFPSLFSPRHLRLLRVSQGTDPGLYNLNYSGWHQPQ
jgi:hypothetical protein